MRRADRIAALPPAMELPGPLGNCVGIVARFQRLLRVVMVGVILATRGLEVRERCAFRVTGCHRPDSLVLFVLGRYGLTGVDEGVPGLGKVKTKRHAFSSCSVYCSEADTQRLRAHSSVSTAGRGGAVLTVVGMEQFWCGPESVESNMSCLR